MHSQRLHTASHAMLPWESLLVLPAQSVSANNSLCCSGALGSPGFISPEIIIGERHTYAMDVFAVGVVLFVLLVGRKPFNIADSESLSYCAMKLADCPGVQDPRQALTPWMPVSGSIIRMTGTIYTLQCKLCI